MTVWMLCTVSVVVMAAVGAMVYTMSRPIGPRVSDEIGAAQKIVRDRLPSGFDLHFSDASETSVQSLGSEKYRVIGWVDLVNPAGQSLRQAFTCVMHVTSDGDWVPDEVDILDK